MKITKTQMIEISIEYGIPEIHIVNGEKGRQVSIIFKKKITANGDVTESIVAIEKYSNDFDDFYKNWNSDQRGGGR